MLGCGLRGTLDLLIIDLSELDFLAASGLSVLAHAQIRAEQRDIGLRVVTGQNHCVTRALTATGLDRQLSLSHTISTAEHPHDADPLAGRGRLTTRTPQEAGFRV
ncbi:hypothetical protein GCM10023214_62570 [Amycolatopsis dongchuanensis]|uniref:STAS domain-containing protein n=2 Tax=Amycolatopsis dongchuanensis TaxID=1070866 RepID=A0ABP8VFT2_9PSEU